MAGDVQSNLALVRGLIEQAPDAVLRELRTALAGRMGGDAVDQVLGWVQAELDGRAVRDTVLAPLRPMFGPREDGMEQLAFPRGALPRLWRALKAVAPDQVAEATYPYDGPGLENPVMDDLCRIAAEALRQRDDDFAALADILDEDQPQGADLLARCLELAPLARPAIAHLPEWLQRMTDERAAVVRLAFRDACDIGDDGGQRLFDILFANLQDPWTILRLAAAVVVRPVDNYISGSELAGFGERVLNDIERRLRLISTFSLDEGEAAGMAMGHHVRIISAGIDEFEQTLNLGREGPWGGRLARSKTALAKAVETHLRRADNIVGAALPQAEIRIGGRSLRQGPRLESPPNPRRITQAQAMLTFVGEVRSSAARGGYNTLRMKVVEEIELRLNAYIEDLLEVLHQGSGEDALVARLYMDQAADLMGRICDDKAAQIVRRRAAAA